MTGLPFFPQPKGQSRLQTQMAKAPVIVVTDRQFKAEVRARDKMRCRMCSRRVAVRLARVPERAEVHHLAGRLGDLRFDARCAVLVCGGCHEKLTGRVAEKWRAVGTRFLIIGGEPRIDARYLIRFERVV